MPRKRKMTQSEIVNAVELQIRRSDFFDNTELQQNQHDALDSYLSRNRVDSVPGRSGALSQDVADMVEAVVAQIMPAFKFDEIAVFDPHGTLDVDQARLESKICNQQLFDANDGDLEIQQTVRDCLLLRNGIIKAYVEEQVDKRTTSYQALSELEFQDVQQPTSANQEIKVTSSFNEDSTIDATITRVTTFRRLNIYSVDPVNFVIEREWTSINPAGAGIVGERDFPTRSELVKEGFARDVVDKIPATSTDTKIGSLARNRDLTPPVWDRSDKAQQRVQRFELYMMLDEDNDGIAERRRIIYAGGGGEGTAGGVILSDEPHPFVPYACCTPFLFPHRFRGLSIYDKLEELERIKTNGLRQWDENIENNNFPELVVDDLAVAEGDITSRRTAGIIRADNVNAVQPIPIQDLGTNSRMFLDYMDKVRSERAGASLDMQSAEGQISDSAHSQERSMSAREALANLIADTIGATLVKQLFQIIHHNLREFFTGPEDWHVGASQFVTADTANWPHRNKVRVTAGMSEHQRQSLRAVLESHLLQQEKLWQAGMDGVLVDLQTYHDTLVDWSKAGGIMSPRRHWVDPRSDEAQQAMQQKQQQAQAEQAQQQAREDRLFNTQLLISDRENRTDLVKHVTELRFKYWDKTLQSEIEELRVEAQGSETVQPDPETVDALQFEGRREAS